MSYDAEHGRRIIEGGKYAPALRENYPNDDIPPDVEEHYAGEWSPKRDGQQPVVGEKPTTGDGDGPADPMESVIAHRMTVLRVNREANRRLDDEDRAQIVLPAVKSLEMLLAEPDPPTRYRVEGLAPVSGRVMLASQYKSGKTTITNNLTRSMVDAEPFLGRFAVHAPAHRLVLIDDELAEDTVRRWLRDQGIINTAAVADVVCLRGRVGLFNLIDDHSRAEWARRLRDLGCDYLVLDCLRPVLDALGLDEGHDVGQFLVAFDALLKEAGVNDATLVHHMGHANERARGDSRLQDWPDAIWRLVRENEEPDSPRYFSAYGRDVDVPEGRLNFDPSTRRLTYNGGTRSDAKSEAAMSAVIAVLAENAAADGMSGNAIEQAVPAEHTQKAIRDGIKLAIKQGMITVSQGPRNANLHSIAHPCDKCRMPVASGAERHESCPQPTAEGLFE